MFPQNYGGHQTRTAPCPHLSHSPESFSPNSVSQSIFYNSAFSLPALQHYVLLRNHLPGIHSSSFGPGILTLFFLDLERRTQPRRTSSIINRDCGSHVDSQSTTVLPTLPKYHKLLFCAEPLAPDYLPLSLQ